MARPVKVSKADQVAAVVHEFVRSGEQPGGAEQRLDAAHPVGEVRLGGPAQRAVRDADAAAAERVVDHFVHLHHVLRIGAGLTVDGDAEDDRVVRVPAALAGRRDLGLVERRDAAARAGRALRCIGSVVDENAAPAHLPPVDVGGRIIEEGRPSGFDQQEEIALEFAVPGGRRQVPGEQAISHGGERLEDQGRAAQLLEGSDDIGRGTAVGEAQQVIQKPAQASVARGAYAFHRRAREAALAQGRHHLGERLLSVERQRCVA
jgi:hypothetical protein